MKYIIFSVLAFMLCQFQVLAQSNLNVDNSVISTAGESADIGNLNVQWTLGEVMIQTFTVGDFSATQGFNQPKKKENDDSTDENNIGDNSGGIAFVPPNNENCDFDLEQNKDLNRQGALHAQSDFPIDGDETYCWYQDTGDGFIKVAQFTGNPYYSPPTLGNYQVSVTDPDFPDCTQILGPRDLGTLDGCCELPGSTEP